MPGWGPSLGCLPLLPWFRGSLGPLCCPGHPWAVVLITCGISIGLPCPCRRPGASAWPTCFSFPFFPRARRTGSIWRTRGWAGPEEGTEMLGPAMGLALQPLGLVTSPRSFHEGPLGGESSRLPAMPRGVFLPDGDSGFMATLTWLEGRAFDVS